MRFWLYFFLIMCAITLCISDSDSSESDEDSGQQGGRGRGRGNNSPRGGRGRGTVNTNRRGNGNTNQQGRGTGNTNQQGRGTGSTNQQGRGTGNTNQQGRDTFNTNQQGKGPGGSNGSGTGSTNQQGTNTGSTNQQGNKDGETDRQGINQDTDAIGGKGNTGKTNQQGTTNAGGNDKQTTTIQVTQPTSTKVGQTQQGTTNNSNGQVKQNRKKVSPCDLTCTPNSNPRRRVCGSDGVTYDTYCFLKAARCYNPGMEYEGRGTCPTSSKSEDSDEVTTPKETVTTRKTPTTLPDAVTTRSPSTESFTTQRATTFKLEGNITTAFVNNDTTVTPQTEDVFNFTTQPPLNMSGNTVIPSEGTTIPSRNTGMPGTTQPFVVDCPNLCPILRMLVCGTDGTTYQSPCVLQLVACVNNDPTLMVAYNGACVVSTLEPFSSP